MRDISEKTSGGIETLSGFSTRHTFSDTVINTIGIGAARRWVKLEFEKFAKG